MNTERTPRKNNEVKIMTRENILSNVKNKYGNLDLDMDAIEKIIDSGEAEEFTYSMIYTGIRMAIAEEFGIDERFFPEEVAEILGVSEEEAKRQMMELNSEGTVEIHKAQQFVVPPSYYS